LVIAYEFFSQQELGEVNAVFKFSTVHGIEYAVTFIEATRISDILDDCPVLSNGVYMIVDAIKGMTDSIPLDAKVGRTVAATLVHYFHTVDVGSIIIFNCDNKDGKQEKRYHTFHRWFDQYSGLMDLIKVDKEILVPAFNEKSGDHYVSVFISLLYIKKHTRQSLIEKELIRLEQRMLRDK
jgi:Family of unknown function (DUF6169)